MEKLPAKDIIVMLLSAGLLGFFGFICWILSQR